MSGSGAFEFARVDLVSNHTVFPNPEHYQALLHGEDLPASTFSSFIHEATHHWCFISPVGTALSALHCSVARRALHWLATGDESETMAALEDLCAYEIALSWLRPLNEGLALFAEYDVFPDFVRPPAPHLPAARSRARSHLGRRVGGVERPALNYHEVADEIPRGAWTLRRSSARPSCC